MVSGGLRLSIGGAQEAIDARAVTAAVSATLDLLDGAQRTLGGAAGQWHFETIVLGSVVLQLANPAAPGAITVVTAGLASLRAEARIPAQWTHEMVSTARRLGRLAGTKGIESINVGDLEGPSTPVDAVVTAHADTALGTSDVSWGSLVGRIDRWQTRRGRSIGLTLDSGETVTANFPAGLERRILDEALDQRVTITGEITRNPAGQLLGIAMHDFVVEEPTVPLGIHRLAGLFSDAAERGLTVKDVLGDRE